MNRIHEDKKGKREKSILLKLSAVLRHFSPHLYSFIFGVDKIQRVEI